MDERSRKIRLGLILQGCVGEALRLSKFNRFVTTPRYDPDAMTPDFLIPDGVSAKFFVEVTQTEARNSFQMKTLRYFEAVCEAKSTLGSDVISVNVLFGNPDTEIPHSLLMAMYGIFDLNVCPRNDAIAEADRFAIAELEANALALAADPQVETDVALRRVVQAAPNAIAILARMLEAGLLTAELKSSLLPLWDSERVRLAQGTNLQLALPAAPTYKRPILESLLLSDSDFEDLVRAKGATPSTATTRALIGKGLVDLPRAYKHALRRVFEVRCDDFAKLLEVVDPERLDADVKARLLRAQLLLEVEHDARSPTVDFSEAIKWLVPNVRRLPVKADIRSLADDEYGSALRKLCIERIRNQAENRWFFLDVQDEERRLGMAAVFLSAASEGPEALVRDILASLELPKFAGVEHTRCWLADLLACQAARSHNAFNKMIFADPEYTGSISNPFNNLTIRNQSVLRGHVKVSVVRTAVKAFSALMRDDPTSAVVDAHELATRLLSLRLDALVKRHSLNPIDIVIEEVCRGMDLPVERVVVRNVLADASLDPDSAAQYRVYVAEGRGPKILINGLYVDDYGGRDKAKEWSARGRSFLYRLVDGTVRPSGLRSMIMVLDGDWHESAVQMLQRSGWVTCRPGQLRAVIAAVVK